MYTKLLEEKDFEDLMNLINVYYDKEHTQPVNYKIMTHDATYQRKNNASFVLFLRDFSCSFSYATKETNDKINELYRKFMLKRMTPTHPEYEDKLNQYLDRQRANNKGIVTD